MKLTSVAKVNEIKRDWVLIDAKNQIFGRILTKVATILRGKHKVYYTQNIDCGDYVVIINATMAKFSGKKIDNKEYFSYSGYFGSTKSKKLNFMLKNRSEKLYRLAIRGMLPKTILGRKMIKRLKIYPDSQHPHTAQIKKENN